MQKVFGSVLAALSLATIGIPASAETFSVSVPYGDLDLSTARGMATLAGRVNAATMQICGKPEIRVIQQNTDHQRCVAATRTSAFVQIARVTGNARVLALNAR